MKKFIAILLACLMIVPSAFAVDLNTFNLYAGLFGAPEISEADGDARDDVIQFKQAGCTITIRHENGKINLGLVQGDGDAFLAYCLAMIMEFDPSSVNVAHNGGQLLLYYLMGKEEPGKHMGQTVSGCYFTVEQEGEGYSFTIMK